MEASQPKPCMPFLLLPLLLGSLVVPTAPLAAAQSASSPARCYYPNGNVASNDTPCSLAADGRITHATCCGDGYACMSNNMCKATGEEAQKPGATIFVRGSCTDSRWASDDCPRFCDNSADPFSDNVGGGNGIGMCRGDGTIFFCIDGAATDCDAGAPTAITTIGVEPTTTTTTSSSSSASATGGSPTTPASSSTPDRSSNSSAVGIAVGASIGAVGIISAAIFAYFLFRRRRKTPQPASALPMGMAAAGPGSGLQQYGPSGLGAPPLTPGWNDFHRQGGYHESVSVMGPDQKSMLSAPFYSPNPQDHRHVYSHQYQPLQQPGGHVHVHEAYSNQSRSNERVEVPAVERPVEAFSTERVELPDSESRIRNMPQSSR